MNTAQTQRDADTNLPANLLAEREVLGAVLEDDALLSEVIASGLKVSHFALTDHKLVFTAMLRLRERNHAIDLITLAEELGNRPESIALLCDLVTGVVLVRGHVLHHVGIVRRKARLRVLVKIGEQLAAAANEDGADPSALVQETLAGLEHTE